MRRKRGSALFCGAGLLAIYLATVAGAEPFEVQWPKGWEVKRFPAPTPAEPGDDRDHVLAQSRFPGHSSEP